MFYRDVVRLGEQILVQAGVEDPGWTSEILLLYITGKKRINIYLDREVKVGERERKYFINAIHRLTSGEPIQYIIGETFFMDIVINIKKGVFIPRPETELIVEQTLKEIFPVETPLILDIGTGSGVIAISLAHFRKDVEIIATDISEVAIKQANENAEINGVRDDICFVIGDMYAALKEKRKFDVIVSNPPYIPNTEISRLPANVMQEPIIALNGGRNGVQVINRIIQESELYLKDNGKVVVEIDPNNVKYLSIPEYYRYKFIPGFSGEKRGCVLWRD